MLVRRATRPAWQFASVFLFLSAVACSSGWQQTVQVTTDLPETPVPTESVGRVTSLSPQLTGTAGPQVIAVVSGRLCYPSEAIPPMTVYAREVESQATYSVHVAGANDFELLVPTPGQYVLFGWTDAGVFTEESLGGIHSCHGVFVGQMNYLGKDGVDLPCGDPEDHTPLVLDLDVAENVDNIYVCDFYSQQSVPKP